MEVKRKLNNGAETIAVTSFLSFTYKPIIQAFANSDYRFPEQFCSKNGKLNTARKFISIGGHTQMYRTNNNYKDYGKQLKKLHKDKPNSQKPCGLNVNSVVTYDERKPDRVQPPVFVPPKIKKEFEYKRNKSVARGYSSLDFRINKLEALDYNSGDDDDQLDFKFYPMQDKPVVQGFDVKEKSFKIFKKVERFKKLNVADVPLTQLVAPTTPHLNERNQLANSILIDLKQLDVTITELLSFKQHVFDNLPRIQGGTISTVQRINRVAESPDLEQTLNRVVEVIKKTHEKVENGVLDKVESTIDKVHNVIDDGTVESILGATNTVSSGINFVSSLFVCIKEKSLEFLKTVIDIVASYEKTFFKLFGPFQHLVRAISQALIVHFITAFIAEQFSCPLTDVWHEMISLVGVVLVNTQWNGLGWRDALISGLRMSIVSLVFNFNGRVQGQHYPKVQGKDSFVLPFATCLGMALCATSGTTFTEKFFNSIKSFGGIISFSGKFDYLLRSVYDIIPEVVKEYCQVYVPAAYEMITLGWYDQSFNKDYNELYDLLKIPDRIYYSSHNVKRFLDLVSAMHEDYIPKYGHFSFFQTSMFFDKVDCVYEEIKRRGLLPGRRHCPFVLWIAGDSGVGKSSLAQYLAMQLIDPEISYEKQVYSWNPALEFQDGYNNQPIVILNDYMQTTDNGEEQLLISMKDACDWILNSSSVDDIKMGKKGEMRFTSKFIIITSNMSYLYNSTYIRDTSAFNRRRDMLVQMKFRDNRVFDHDHTDYRWCDFSIKDPILEMKEDKIPTIQLLFELIKKRYESHMAISQSRVNIGLKIQSENEVYEDALSTTGYLRSVILQRLIEHSTSAHEFLKKHYGKLLLGVAVAAVPIFTLLRMLYSPHNMIRSFNSGDSITVSKVHKVVANRLLKNKVRGTEILNNDSVLIKVEANLFRITTCIRVDGMAHVRSVNALYIGDDLILVPKHIFYRGDSKINEGDMILINKGQIMYETTFQFGRLIEHSEDYAFYNVKFIMPRYKKIDYLFDDGISPMDECINIMVLRQAFDAETITRYMLDARFTKNITCYDDIGAGKTFTGTTMLKFRGPLAYGDCGSPVLAQVNGNWRIMGIHVGGIDTTNYAQLVSISRCSRGDQPDIQGCNIVMDHSHMFGQFIIKSIVEPKSFPFANTTTKICRSICFGVLQYPHLTEPCILSPKDPRNVNHVFPLHEGTVQLGKVLNPINSTDFPEVMNYLIKRHRSMVGKSYALLTMHEAINGIEGLDRLDFQTSPGYPYTINQIRKQHMFSFNGKYWEPTVLFLREYNDFIEQAKISGMHIIWTNCAKDERRPIDKIHKTRIFTVSNIVFTVFGRQLFGNYVANYVKNRHAHGGMVGINPYGPEWHQLFEYLDEFKSANDGDYSKFDKDLLKEVFELFSQFSKYFIPDQDFQGKSTHFWIDEILYNTLFSDILTILDSRKVIITSQHGNPSGWFLTVFFNDFANKVYMYLAWMRIIPYSPNRVQEYLDNVRIVFYGDDNLYTVSKKYETIFNAATISAQLLDNYNIVYTSGDKSDVVSYNKSLLECTFLKNHFIPHYTGAIVAGLDKKTIQEMVSWTKDHDKSLDMILNTALRFSYFWGVDYFQSNYLKLRPYSDDLVTYIELDYEFQSIKGLNFELYDKMEKQRYEQLLSELSVVKNTIKVQSMNNSEGFRSDKTVREAMRNFGVSMVNQNIQEEKTLPVVVPQVHIPEVASTLKKLLARPVLVRNDVVNNGASGDVAVPIVFPDDWVNASRSLIDVAAAYFYFRGKIKMQVTLQSTPYNSGAMVAHVSYKTVSSFLDASNNTKNLNDLNCAWLRPHVELDYSDNAANKIMDIPWKYKREYVEFFNVTADSVCDIYFTNYIPNSESARILVYMWVEDAEVVVTKVDRPVTIEDSIPVVQGLTLFGDNVTNINTTNQIDTVKGNIEPKNIIGDQFDTKASLNLSALDQPTIPLEQPQMTLTRFGFASNADQIEHKEKMMLHPQEQMMSCFETFGTSEDEMTIDYLKSKWSPVQTTSSIGGSTSPIINYGITTSPGVVLAAFAVGPHGGNDKFFNRNQYVSISFLDYITRNHTFWRGSRSESGSLEYRFKFACNRFQSGRVAVLYNPGANWYDFFGTTSTTTLTLPSDYYGACYTAYFDINGQDNEIIVRLPFVSTTPWKTLWAGCASAITNQNKKEMLNQSFCGVLTLVAITPLVSPVGSPTAIKIASFIRGAPGFEIAGISSRNGAIGCGRPPDPVSIVVAQDRKENVVSATLSNNTRLVEKLALVRGKDKKIKIDCWEILRQLVRFPKVEFELPYYHKDDSEEEEIKIQSKDYVFLGDKGDDKFVDNDIKPTTSIRDVMKVKVPFFQATNICKLYKMSSVFNGSYYNNLCAVGSIYSVPLMPTASQKVNEDISVRYPPFMQWGGMYQGFRGSMKLRIKTTLQRNTPNDQNWSSLRPTPDFTSIVFLNEQFIGVSGTSVYSQTNPTIVDGIERQLFGNHYSDALTLDYFTSQHQGLQTIQVPISDTATFDLEVPVHLFNKYHEIGVGDPARQGSTDSYPILQIAVFTYFDYIDSSPRNATYIKAQEPVKLSYYGAVTKVEGFISIGDEARFGVLDDYPSAVSAATDYYLSPVGQLPPLDVVRLG